MNTDGGFEAGRPLSGSADAPVAGAMQRLAEGARAAAGRGPAPVHLWNPAYCGEIDMRIAVDGSWHYNGSPIRRPAMVKLFASILRKDADRHVLVTPVERVGIIVDDAPFVAVAMDSEAGPAGDRLFVRTNLDDVVEVGAAHPVRFESGSAGGLKPYIRIRGDLWALASRSLTQDLVARFTIEPAGGVPMIGLRAGGQFFAAAAAEGLEDLC